MKRLPLRWLRSEEPGSAAHLVAIDTSTRLAAAVCGWASEHRWISREPSEAADVCGKCETMFQSCSAIVFETPNGDKIVVRREGEPR